MEVAYKLENFEGPLDLLLHLIEKNKVDIYDIPISDITKQYMSYIRADEFADLDTMSEFLVMAATLIDIKSRLLLPKKEEDTEIEEADPRLELVERLLEYKKYKQLASELDVRREDVSGSFFKEPTIPKEVLKYEPQVDLDKILADIDLELLNKIYEEVLKRKDFREDKQRSNFGTIKKEPISLEKKLGSVLSYVRKKRKFSFRDLLDKSTTKTELVVTFLAVLELMKIGKINLVQESSFSDMQIESLEEHGANEEIDFSDVEDL